MFGTRLWRLCNNQIHFLLLILVSKGYWFICFHKALWVYFAILPEQCAGYIYSQRVWICWWISPCFIRIVNDSVIFRVKTGAWQTKIRVKKVRRNRSTNRRWHDNIGEQLQSIARDWEMWISYWRPMIHMESKKLMNKWVTMPPESLVDYTYLKDSNLMPI